MYSFLSAATLALGLVVDSSAAAAIDIESRTSTKHCDKSKLNTTTYDYTVLSTDTIFTVAEKTGRGACDIARWNCLTDAELIYAGETLFIPAQVCNPDSTTCILQYDRSTTATCIYGGPHTYTTVANDTVEKIALAKFKITTASLQASISRQLTVTDTEIIPVGNNLKIPGCSPTTCEIFPAHYPYGVFKDLADEWGVTVGQLMALNPTYNHSESSGGPSSVGSETGPVLAFLKECKAYSNNVTSIS